MKVNGVKKTDSWVVVAVLLMACLSGAAWSGTAEFWIGDSSGNPVTQVAVPTNGEFSLSVWATTDYQTRATEVLFGYDTTNSKGALATKLDNKISLVSVTYGTIANAMTSKHSYDWYGGDYVTSASENRPGGYRLAIMLPVAPPTALGPYTNATKLFDIKLKNVGVAVGQEYCVGLWNARPGATSGSTFCTLAGTTTRFQDLGSSDPYNPAYGAGSGWSVKVTNGGSQSSVGIGDAKKLADGVGISMSDYAVVTVGSGILSDGSVYIESENRCDGIKVVPSSSMSSVAAGDRVKLAGTMATDTNGERYISEASVVSKASGDPLKPLGMTNKALGGSGIADASGLGNIGLLVKVWGKVSSPSSADNTYVLDDGSGVGVKVLMPAGSTLPTEGSNAVVTGISSCQKEGSKAIRLLKAI